MNNKSTSEYYGRVAIIIHWLSALLIVALIGSGFRAAGMEDLAPKAMILRIHVPLGVVIFLLTLSRIGWWFWADNKPDPVATSNFQNRSSKFVHTLFYVLILGMAISGIGMIVLSEAGPLIFGDSPQTLPNFWDYRPRIPHGIGARLMLVLLILHVGAAMYHQFILRDGLLGRIWFKR